MQKTTPQLPVEAILPKLEKALKEHGTAVLQAPPGSGKTTRVPLSLLDKGWLQNQRILMLEPRRLAATNAARYMSSLIGEKVGETIGYAIRYERKISHQTRLEVMTEGLLVRRLQSDPEVKGVGLVIFDEFHERSLQADLALALCRDVQQGLRDDLRILVMSATLDAEPLAELLGNCPIVSAAGRSYPVTIDHIAEADRYRIAEATAQGVRHALKDCTGDILAFMPGTAEIRRCREQLGDLSSQIDLRPLYGGLPFAEQEAAIMPGNKRRVVLATNVAETSLTIEGIECVVDSGWERRPRFDAARGMTHLETLRISRASAEQRAGRAGRIGPGRCLRLWSQGTHGALLPFAPPEIRQADLSGLAFELAQWGLQDASQLTWMDPPPEGHLAAARQLLTLLGAFDDKGQQTSLGLRMSRYPTHPRLARLLAAAIDEGRAELGCNLVALLSERDLSLGPRQKAKACGPSDLLERLEILRRDHSPRTAAIRRAATFWKQLIGTVVETVPEPGAVSRLLAAAYPDRIGMRRKSGSDRYLLRNGQGVALSASSMVRDSEWLVAVETVGRPGAEDEIRLASALDRDDIEDLFGCDLKWQREAGWDDSANRVVAREVRRLGALVLQERPVAATPGDTVPALLELVRRHGLDILPWTKADRQFQARAVFLHHALPEHGWPDSSDLVLTETLQDWLSGALYEVKSRSGLKRIDLSAALKSRIGWQRLKELERMAPERLQVPSGSNIRIDYTTGDLPVLAVKLQEMFGLAETPKLADGRVPVVIHLLSPAGRPLAVTRDLRSFWNTVYPEVQKEMKGRYPKHPWPDDPWLAKATKKTTKRL